MVSVVTVNGQGSRGIRYHRAGDSWNQRGKGQKRVRISQPLKCIIKWRRIQVLLNEQVSDCG